MTSLRPLLPIGLALSLSLACASAPEAPPDRGVVWGYVSALPREGVTTGAGAYGDRRLRDVELVDYSRPGFAVVYVGDAAPHAAADVELRIHSSGVGTRLEPDLAAMPAGAVARIRNTSERRHLVSCPAADFVEPVEPGASVEISTSAPGPYEVFLLDAPDAAGTVFAAPGAFDVVDAGGRFELGPLLPGRHRLATWHPRLPPTERSVEVEAGRSTRVDLEIGVGRGQAPEGD